MATRKQKLKCVACGAEMNHHATKVDYSATTESRKEMEAEFGGVVKEFHLCPKCGNSASREAE